MADLDPEDFRALAHRLVDWVADHRAGLDRFPVKPGVLPGDVLAALPRGLPEQPSADVTADLIALLDDVIVPGSLLWQHPGFYGYFPANASLASLLGDLASGAIGSQGMLWATSPAGTELEQRLLDDFAVALGLPASYTFAGGGGGSLQDSASSATLVALLAALHRRLPTWRDAGTTPGGRVYVTAGTHSSVLKAARVAGLGDGSVVVVPFADGGFAMDPAALAGVIADDTAAGRTPVLVCATLGTTGTGAMDPLRPIVEAAAGTWVHVDAAWAGVAALCPEHRGMLDGVDRVDSFSTDAHKWLGTAFDASLMWTRHGRALPEALSVTPEYLRNTASDSGEVVDYRDWQVPLGRRMRALKVWSVVQARGLEGLRTDLRDHIAWTAALAEHLVASGGFTLAAPVSLALACLHVVGPDGAPDDTLGRAVLEAVNATGDHFVTHTVVGGRFAIRVAVGSVSTRREHVVALAEALVVARADAL